MAFANVTRADLSGAGDVEQGAGTTIKTRAWVEGWLSVACFAPYLEASAGDVDLAIELYEWNVTLGQVFMRDIAHFEVALRNAYDELMQGRWDGNEHWLLDEASPVRRPIWRISAQGKLDANRINRRTIDTVVRGMGAACSSDALVAGLTLGFWVHLTDRTRDVTLWRTHLFRA